MNELVPKDLHFNVERAKLIVASALDRSQLTIMDLFADGAIYSCYQTLKNSAERVKSAVERNDEHSALIIMQEVTSAREVLLNAGVSEKICFTEAQVLNLLNSLFEYLP